jgi:general secretion pathway protein G
MVFRTVNGKRGFTLIELLVVMTIIALLLTIAVPRYFGSVDRTREAVLHENLATLRDSLDKFYADTGKYPVALGDLVAQHYLRKIPVDPITDSASTWVELPPDDPKKGGVYDVKSGARSKARDGTPYSEW